ncbi:unnamed protein product, partial [Closterium sp. NIES-64]
ILSRLAATAYPNRLYASNTVVTARERAALMAGADFVLLPSRFEPCGLTDVEFAWKGALGCGFQVVRGWMMGMHLRVGWARPRGSTSRSSRRATSTSSSSFFF